MHSLIAISPTVLDNWADIRYLADKLGYDKGVLLANIPRSWTRMVYEACQLKKLSEIDRKKVEVILSIIKSKSVKTGYKNSFLYNSELEWLDNLKSPILDSFIDAVVTSSSCQKEKFYDFYNPEDTINLDDFFRNATSKRIKQTAEAIGGSAEYLLLGENKVNIIDPYFQPKNKNTKVLTVLAAISKAQNSQPKTYVIHCSYDAFIKAGKVFNNAEVASRYRSLLKNLLNDKSKIEIYFWTHLDDGSGDIHARYLITNKGGLLFDRGFVEPEDHDARSRLTLVQTISKKLSDEVLETYNENNNELKCIEKILL